jgi:hypothetical protein
VTCIAAAAASSQCACPSLARSWSGWVGRRTLGAEELAGDVEGLAAHNDNLLSVEQLLSDGAGEATEQVPLAVDDLKFKSARGSRAMLPADRGQRRLCETATANLGGRISCVRKVRTITGSKVDMVSIPGVMLEVSCRGRGFDEGRIRIGMWAKRGFLGLSRASAIGRCEHQHIGRLAPSLACPFLFRRYLCNFAIIPYSAMRLLVQQLTARGAAVASCPVCDSYLSTTSTHVACWKHRSCSYMRHCVACMTPSGKHAWRHRGY